MVCRQRAKVREFGESSKSWELIDFQTFSDYFVKTRSSHTTDAALRHGI
jgi:hypothetical protein